MFGLDQITLEVRYGFVDSRFNRVATPLYFAHQHGALYRGYAKVSHTLLADLPSEPSLRFLFDEECSKLVLHDLEDEADILAD